MSINEQLRQIILSSGKYRNISVFAREFIEKNDRYPAKTVETVLSKKETVSLPILKEIAEYLGYEIKEEITLINKGLK